MGLKPGDRIEPRFSRGGQGSRAPAPGVDQPAVLPRSPNELLEPQRAPAPPHRKVRRVPRAASRTVRILNGLLTFLLVAMATTAGAFFLLRYQFDKPGPLQYSTVIVIPKGDGMNAIADRLEKEGIVADSRVFAAAVLWFRANGKLKFGEYEIKKSASMREVLDTLVEGKATLSKVTIPEGLTSFQIVELLKKQEQLVGDITEIPAEGTLLPETYKYAPGSERKDLIERMRTEHQQRVEKLWQTKAANLPFATLNEAITMASLVEKETGRPDERARVAGVFLNRLKKHMRLQSDPTIIYHLTNGHGPLGRPILKSEIEDKNPYNTYKIDGLPPGPICNPGSAAIEAVLNPADTKDLFFVADGSGGHAFAESIRDHVNNVKRWRQLEKDAAAKNGAAAVPETSAGLGTALDDEMQGVTVDNAAAAGGVAVVVDKPTDVQASSVKIDPAAAAVAPAADATVVIPLPARKPKKK